MKNIITINNITLDITKENPVTVNQKKQNGAWLRNEGRAGRLTMDEAQVIWEAANPVVANTRTINPDIKKLRWLEKTIKYFIGRENITLNEYSMFYEMIGLKLKLNKITKEEGKELALNFDAYHKVCGL